MVRLLRAVVACLVLSWLGGVAWPRQIDDQFITLAFAERAAHTGLPRWGTGELVEACSSPLQLVLGTLSILAGADPNLFVKRLAAGCGLALLLVASWRLPKTPVATVLLLALAAWEPLGWWTFAGMETTLYTLLLAFGWAGVLAIPAGDPRRDRLIAPLGALWLASTAHPEGSAHLLLALALSFRRAPRVVAGLLVAWLAWHTMRFTLYGELLPTPFLVKIAANPGLGRQWGQVGGDLATTVGLVACLLVGFRMRAIFLLPAAIQVAVALRAEPDWMGHGRHLLPGVAATVLAWGSLGTPRKWNFQTWILAVPVALFGGTLEAPSLVHDGVAYGRTGADEPFGSWFALAFDTPQLEDVRWIVAEAPAGSSVMLEDVGMPGNVPGVAVIDTVGLTDRLLARANAGDRAAEVLVERRLRARPPALVRRMRYGAEGIPHPLPWLRLPEPTLVEWPQGVAALYRLTEDRPTEAEILDRWRGLHARYPSQGPLAWELALALAETGHLAEAARVATDMAAEYPSDPVVEALPAAVFAPFDIETAGVRPFDLRQGSRLLPRSEVDSVRLLVAVDPPGGRVSVRWSCEGAEQVVDPASGPTALPPWTCPGDQARLRVSALDERPRAPLPEHLRVGLVAP